MELFFITLILSSLACVRGQDLNKTIVGCADLECPPSSADKQSDNCTVTDKSFGYVGVTRIPTSQKSLQGLSWTKGYTAVDLPNNNRTFQSYFYLGTPPGLKLNGTGACSVFFNGISTSLSFGGEDGKNETSQGTCADALGSDCVNGLVDHAKRFVQDSGSNNTDLCSALQDELRKNVDNACLHISSGVWTNLTSIDLAGNAPGTVAVQPISALDNSTSTCWPVLPKQNQLVHVTDYIAQGTLLSGDAQAALVAITPILTVFYPTEKDSAVADIDASLTCVKVVGPPRASLDTINNGTGEGAAASLSPSSAMLATAMMGSFLAVLFLSI
ncbi:hypothetical protein F4777DRAFT_429431 [Nemania sp. FL0916]|nr:hypothetical protein F4777DRAFT_429431 [Nemania sp. FL0916]